MKVFKYYILYFCLLTTTIITKANNISTTELAADSVLLSDTLRTVTITGSNVVNYADRDVIHITKGMRKGARNTAQLIGKIQGFDCDIINNELTYYGSKNILLVVDSIPKMSEYIKELHHMRFDKVEVIHSPSGKWAEYDVVINLHARPDYEGYEGNISDNGRFLPNNGNGNGKNLSDNTAGGQITWTKNKWNFVARYDFTFHQGEYHEATNMTDYKSLGFLEHTTSPATEKVHNRKHNIYTAIDYQFNKDHHVSVTYALTSNNADDALDERKKREWAMSDQVDIFKDIRTNDAESSRHTLGAYYGGTIKGWGLFYDFNYINNLNNHISQYEHDNYFYINNPFSDRMNYVWSNIGFNKRFNRYYLTASHSFTYKGYGRDNQFTGTRLSKDDFYRNQVTIWMSYRFPKGTEWTLGARLAHVHLKSMREENFDNNAAISSTLFHKFNNKTWLRVNYWYDAVHPELDQITTQGYFTDSLHYHIGNPSLETNIIQRGRIWLNCFNMLGIQAGFNYAPNQYAMIMYPYNVETNQGDIAHYIAARTENTKYLEWWGAVNLTKQFGDFNVKAHLKYQTMRAKFVDEKADNDGFSGYINVRHYYQPFLLTTEFGYHYNNYYGVSPQGWVKREMDFFKISVKKELLKDERLSLALQYFPPIHFTRMKYTEITDCFVQYSQNVQGILQSNKHAIRFNLSYRFADGKSVRKYHRTMIDEY